jgi:hypothetical protein
LNIRAQIDPDTIIVSDYNSLLSLTHTSSDKITNKETSVLNYTTEHMHLTDIYRIFNCSRIHILLSSP